MVVVDHGCRQEAVEDEIRGVTSFSSGNAVILRGGSDAVGTNKALYKCIKSALQQANIPDAVFFIGNCSREIVYQLLQANQYIDLVIARGGYDMVRDIQNKSKIPILAHAAGGARIYVDKSADLEMALRIILNAKLSKPAACNSVDTVLVHERIADLFVQKLVERLEKEGVIINHIEFAEVGKPFLRTSQTRLSHFMASSQTGEPAQKDSPPRKLSLNLTMDKDVWNQEFLDKEIAIKIVLDYKQALKHIQNYTKGHTECIVAQDRKVIDAFIHSIDAASLMVNCSPRLHDGFIYGLGAEMGIATGKLHVRGPVGLEGLTTYKWVVVGKGQIRE